jgi:hypothetical protein
MKMLALFSMLCFVAITSTAQAPQAEDAAAAYTKTITQRAGKIVATLGISDANAADKVQSIIVQQYRDLNDTHEITDSALKVQKLKQYHESFLKNLSGALNKEQVDKVKDGMTYNVFNVTYTAYQDMIPTLTDNQKTKIYEWLKEAREKAMDEGSSESKHKVFGKYKGRINNYLSTEGYDLKKEEKAWQERLRKKREEG